MLLAAGRGERLRPLTETTPKALVEVNGRALIERHLDALSRAGIRKVVINLGWLGDRLMAHIGGGDRYGLQVIYSDEGDDILETGGGIVRALPFLGDEPFLVVNADIVTDVDFSTLDCGADEPTLVLVNRPEDRPVGDFGLDGDRICNEPADYVFSGVSLYPPAFFTGCEVKRFSVVPMLRDAADQGRLRGVLHAGFWADVGTPERLERITRALESREGPPTQ